MQNELQFSGGVSETCYGVWHLCDLSNYFCFVLAMGYSPPTPPTTLSCGSKIGGNLQCDLYATQWQTAISLLSDSHFTVSDIARFGSSKRISDMKNLTVYWGGGQTLRRPPFPNIRGHVPLRYLPGIAAHGNRRTLIVGGWTMKLDLPILRFMLSHSG